MSHSLIWRIFHRSLVCCCVEVPVYAMHIILPLPAWEAGCVDSKPSVCIVIGWVGGRNVLMHKYIKHWNYNLMVCGIIEGSSCSLYSLSLYYSPLPPYAFSLLLSPSLTCFHSLQSQFHNAHCLRFYKICCVIILCMTLWTY